MPVKTPIAHKGIIESISSQKLTVRFTSISACAGCHAKGACSAADMQEKIVEIKNDQGSFTIGETVEVILNHSQGFEAILLGYVYPFLIVFTSLIILSLSGVSELYAGLFSLLILVPYYAVLFYLRNTINKKFQFTIRKPD